MDRAGRLRVLAAVLGGLVLIGLLLAGTGVIGAPTVLDVQSQWGAITEETAEVRVAVTVENPNPVAIPPIVRLSHTTRLNTVVVATDRTEPIGLLPGRSTVHFSIPVRNDRIDDWWVTHVNGDERSTMTIDARIEGPLGLSVPAATERLPIETAFVDAVAAEEPTVVEIAGERVVVIGNETATWGEATLERTPVTFSARLANEHDDAIGFDGLGYRVRMNDIVLGEGVTHEPVRVAPGETGTVTVDAELDTQRIPTWWVSHLRGGERTDLVVTLYGLVDPDAGEPVGVPLIERRAVITTDLLGTGASSVEPVEASGPVLDVSPPSIGATTLRWGTVEGGTTAVVAAIAVDTPDQDSPLAGLITVTVGHAVSINEVPVASGVTDVGRLPPGSGTIEITAALDDGRVPEWWARHLNQGERSTMSVATTARADAGITTVPVETPSLDRRFTTDLLAELNDGASGTIAVRGQPVLEVRSARARWGPATAEVAPIRTAVVVRSRSPVPVTVRELDYRVELNGIVLADRTAPGRWTIAPGGTATIDPTFTLDNERMAEWWPTHIRNGETSTLTVEVRATVAAGGRTERVRIDALGAEHTIETDLLGEEGQGS